MFAYIKRKLPLSARPLALPLVHRAGGQPHRRHEREVDLHRRRHRRRRRLLLRVSITNRLKSAYLFEGIQTFQTNGTIPNPL